MKKIQRGFAVEYKSARRKHHAKTNSIWGEMDLKTVARDLEEEVSPLLPGGFVEDNTPLEVSSSEADPNPTILTPAVGPSTTAAETQETSMADDTDTITEAEAPLSDEAIVPLKKTRKPRTKRTSPDAAAKANAGSGGINGPKKRGRKPKVTGDAAVSELARVERPSAGPEEPGFLPTAAGDEMAELLQLEAENQRLRKLLAEKLRAENAELRKKLNLS